MLDATLYIACLNLTGRRALVVGAGRIGLEKIEGLLACGANVKVVATQAVPQVMDLAASGEVELREKPYEASDLDGCFLAIAATSDTELNTQVYEDAEARSMLVNVVDVPDLCNFILPAIVRNDFISIAISTAGASPALAKRMRREAGEAFGPEYAQLGRLLDEVRAWAKETLPTYDDRKDFFEAIVNGDPDPIELLRRGDEHAVRGLIETARRRAEESVIR
ncbi:MAG TPA: bifunctional precorrin-2 dehydrogenase/sirohydrochlorin ferrochelatase [Actinomycetota bacterium]|nr:bifunctional precorrin-2 dehydrogenase/sirohydrochlorin ferrochelatase [Actinomycetota bacterium]